MRTTITLEPDVLQKIKTEMKRTGHGFKEVVNSLLRRSFTAPRLEDKPFKLKARRMGLRQDLDFSNIGELIERLEGPFHK